MPTLLLIVSLVFSLAACSKQETKPGEAQWAQYVDNQYGAVNHAEKEMLQNQVASIEAESEYDDNGNITSMKGFEKSEKLKTIIPENHHERELSESEESIEELESLIKSEEPAFEYTPPEGTTPEFSPPILVLGSSLALVSSELCEAQDYQQDVPKIKDLYQSAKDTNQCGSITLNFCIKLSVTGSDINEMVQAPSIQIATPCPEQSFANAGISIREPDVSDQSKASIELTFKPFVKEMYLTNQADCAFGGHWEAANPLRTDWLLDNTGENATVYVKFRDLSGNESSCFSDTFELYVPPVTPQDYGLSLNDGSDLTNQKSVTLSLAGTNIEQVYVTNSENCLTGGAGKALTLVCLGTWKIRAMA